MKRTRYGLTLYRDEHTWWRTEDNQYEICQVREITTCERSHPVRFSKETIRWANEPRQEHDRHARFVRSVLAEGKRGYVCEGYDEHDRPCGWDIRHVSGGESDLYDTLDGAWKDLAKSLGTVTA